MAAHLLRPPAPCRLVLVGASEYFRTRILRWEGDPWSQHGTDGKMVLVEECEDCEVEAAVAVVRLMYEAKLPPGLSALQLAQVRVAYELCCFDTSAYTRRATAKICSGVCRCAAWLTAGALHPASVFASQLLASCWAARISWAFRPSLI